MHFYRHFTLSISIAFVTLTILVSNVSRLSASFEPDKSWGWLEPQNFTDNLGESRLRTVLADASGNLHVVWNDNSVYPFTFQLLYRMLDEERNLSPVKLVPGVAHGNVPLDVVVDDDGTVHLLHLYGGTNFNEHLL